MLNKKTVLTIFTSTCTGCRETSRIRLLTNPARRKSAGVNIIIIFGKDNNKDEIKKYALLNNWHKLPLTVGIFNLCSEFDQSLYSELYELDADPKSIVLNKKMDIIFKETMRNTSKVSEQYLMDIMK